MDVRQYINGNNRITVTREYTRERETVVIEPEEKVTQCKRCERTPCNCNGVVKLLGWGK